MSIATSTQIQNTSLSSGEVTVAAGPPDLLLLDIARSCIFADPRRALGLTTEFTRTGAQKDIELLAEAYSLRAKAHFFLSQFSDVLSDLEIAKGLTRSDSLRNRLDILTADCYQQLERYDEALALVESTLASLDERTDAHAIADVLNTRALAELHLGRTAEALRHAMRGVELTQNAGVPAIEGRLLCTISCIYLTLREWEHVLDFAQRSKTICEENRIQNTLAYALNMIGSAYLGKRDFPTARVYLTRSQQIFESLGNMNGQALTWNNLGVSYFNERDYQKALPFYELSLEAARSLGQPVSEAVALSQIAYIHAQDPSLQTQALREYNEALAIARAKGETRCEEYVLASLIGLYEDLGKWEAAHQHQKQLTELRVQIVRQQTSEETKKLKRELEAKEKEHLADLNRVKAQALQEQLTEATVELSNFALRILRQNEKIDLIHSKAKAITSALTPRTTKALLEAIESLRQDDTNYQRPEKHVESRHAEFIQKLSTAYPALSNTELKVAALLRMGLNSKEIANILFTSHRTIETHRHHLRKKLPVDPSTTLTAVLKTF